MDKSIIASIVDNPCIYGWPYSGYSTPIVCEHEYSGKRENCHLISINTVLKIDCKGNLQSWEKLSPIEISVRHFEVTSL
jgi:hypothetical protein